MNGVLSWPEPKNVKDVRKFLGLANYYRRFIKDFAQIARLINMLTITKGHLLICDGGFDT